MHEPRKYSFGQILEGLWLYILLIAVVVALISLWLFAASPNISPLRLSSAAKVLQILPPEFQRLEAEGRPV